MRLLTARYAVAASLFCAWACAKSNDQATGDDSFTPTQGNGGSSTTNGGSGGTVATGGSTSPTTGGSSTGGNAATGGADVGGSTSGGATSGGATGGGNTPGSGASGGAQPGTGGAQPGTGGAQPGTGGAQPGTGGAQPGTGGAQPGTGGSVSGSAGAPVTSGGGMGTGGTLPFDPNFKPPNMTSFAKIVVMYTASNAMKSTSNIQFTLNLVNQTDAAYPMSTVTVRYWMSAEPPPSTMLYYSSSTLGVKAAPKFVTNHANSYLEFTFGATGSLPPSTDPQAQNDGTIQGGVQAGSGVNEMFNQGNDWSFDATAAMSKANGKITVYDGTTLIWGCEPSEVCAMDSTTTGGGEAGAAGVPAP